MHLESLQELSSDNEEADTRIVLQARDAAVRGYQQVNVLSHDKDVLALFLAHRQDLCQELWVFSGTSRAEMHSSRQDLIARGEEEVAAGLSSFHWFWYNQPVCEYQ